MREHHSCPRTEFASRSRHRSAKPETNMAEDTEKLSRLMAIAEGLGAGGPDGWAGVQSILRELEALEPG